jgi:hypothetical protein
VNLHIRNRELVEGKHKIMCGLMGKDIDLIYANPPGRTDCESYVSIPIEDPDSPLIHDHEIDHNMWKTNLHALDSFAHGYFEELVMLRPVTLGVSSPGAVSEVLNSYHTAIKTTANVLDDLRITSNRHLIWPGSAYAIKERWRRMIMTNWSKRSFFLDLMAVGLGIPLAGGRGKSWLLYESIFGAATRLVSTRRGYATVLVATKQLLDATIELMVNHEVAQPRGVPSPGNAFTAAHQRHREPATEEMRALKTGQLLNTLGSTTKLVHEREVFNTTSRDKDPEATKRMVRTALGQEPPDFASKVCEESDEEIRVIASRLTRTRKENPEEVLKEGLGDIHITELIRGEVDEWPLLPEHLTLSDRLRHDFERIRGVKRRRLVEDGGAFDPNLFIEAKLGHKDMDVFVDDSPSRGFSAIILADMSGSMFEHWGTVAPTCAVLTRALKFPFSYIELWGFSGSETGVTHMFHFKDPMHGYRPARHLNGAWKLTPLHAAVPFAVRRLRQMQGEVKHLFVLTDGMPQSVGHPMLSKQDALMNSVAESVMKAKSQKVHTAALLIGKAIGNVQASHMFGQMGWARIPDVSSGIYHQLVDSVRNTFTSYLRR